jgi:hypothetical protein
MTAPASSLYTASASHLQGGGAGGLFYETFFASVRSVGTAVTLASVGVYLHRRGFVEGTGKRTLALLSQQVTFPLFLFTKIVYCNQDWSSQVRK